MASCMSASSPPSTPHLSALRSHVSPEMALGETASDPSVIRSTCPGFRLRLTPLASLSSGSPLPLLQLLLGISPFAPSPACCCTHSFPSMAHPHWGTSAPRTTEMLSKPAPPVLASLLPTEPTASWCPAVFAGTSRWPCRLSTSPLEHLVGFPRGCPFHQGASPSASTQV